MKAKYLIVSATHSEVANLIEQEGQTILKNHLYSIWDKVHILITGVGQVNTTYSLMRYFMDYDKPDNLINVGICGSFSNKYTPGTIVQVCKETAANQLVEQDGRWLTWANIGLIDKTNRTITPTTPHWAENIAIPRVAGLTVDFLTDDYSFIQKRKEFFQCQVETMEGAAVFTIAMREKIPVLQIRSISNYVEQRDKKHWSIEEAKKELHIFASQKLKPLITKKT